MRKEACGNCAFYKKQEDKSGREWMNATGWCELPRLSTKRRRINEDNWCDQYSEKQMPAPVDEDVEADSFAVESTKSFEHWRLTIREKLADIKKQLDELDTLVNTPYEDLE
jgi:hypothetical protein